MASKSSTVSEYLPDGSFDWSYGVDSSVVTTLQSDLNPNGLPRNALAWLNNATVRGGGITQRTGWQPLAGIIASGYWQGGFMYQPDSEFPYLVCQISGLLYSVLMVPPYTVTDLTGGDPSLVNPASPAVAERAWFCQGENYLIIQAGDYYIGPASILVNAYGQPLIQPSTTLPLIWDGKVLRRSRGLTTTAPAMAPGINEIPAATCMDYFGQRFWYAQARQYSGGDMVGGPSGTAPNHYRDSILCVTENPLCFGGDGFTVPTSAGNIRALKHSANINATLGEGQLFIFTRKVVYSLTAPVTRTDWIGANINNQPVQTVIQLVNGAVNDISVVAVNGDLFYQSLEPAVRSLITAVRNFQQWANTPISQNEQRALQVNDRSLMRFSGGIEFDSRLLQLVLPKIAPDGVNVVNMAILPLDFDVVSNLIGQENPVWEGAYDGLQFLQLFTGDFGGLNRAFAAIVSEINGSIDVWELTTSERREDGDNRVTWAMETPAYTWFTHGLELKLKELLGGECWIDKVSGTVDMDVYFRQDADPCWRFWYRTSVCAARGCLDQNPVTVCYPPEPNREGYKYPVVFPKPPTAGCDSMGIRPKTIGYQFQVKIVLKGWCRIRGLLLYAIPHDEPQYQGLINPPGAVPQGMARLPSPFSQV